MPERLLKPVALARLVRATGAWAGPSLRSRGVRGELLEQASFDAAGLVPVRADLSGPAQGGHVAGHDDLAVGKAGVLLLGEVVAPQVPAFLPDGQVQTCRPGGQGGLGRDQDDGRLGTLDPGAHILIPCPAAGYGGWRWCSSSPGSCGILRRAVGPVSYTHL